MLPAAPAAALVAVQHLGTAQALDLLFAGFSLALFIAYPRTTTRGTCGARRARRNPPALRGTASPPSATGST